MWIDANIPVKERAMTDKTTPKRVDDLVDRKVDATGTPNPHPNSVLSKAKNTDAAVTKKKRIVVSDDDDSSDDVPLVYSQGSHLAHTRLNDLW